MSMAKNATLCKKPKGVHNFLIKERQKRHNIKQNEQMGINGGRKAKANRKLESVFMQSYISTYLKRPCIISLKQNTIR